MAHTASASVALTHSPRVPSSLWAPYSILLFERLAYYGVASLVLIYMTKLGLGTFLPASLNSLLWALVYFLPVVSGSVADRLGFRRSLLAALTLLTAGYFLLGSLVWLWGCSLDGQPAAAGRLGVVASAALGILLVGVGGSMINPCISGTVQRTPAASRAIAFSFLYMIINVGSVLGKGTSAIVRSDWGLGGGLASIFGVSMLGTLLALVTVLLFYHEPPVVRQRGKRVLADIVLVLGKPRFVKFLLITSGYWLLWMQSYQLLPIFMMDAVMKDPPMELFHMCGPLIVVALQVKVTKLTQAWTPIGSILFAMVIVALCWGVNLLPILIGGGEGFAALPFLPIAGIFVVLTIGCLALSELFVQARVMEYLGSLAPHRQEAMFLGCASLPIALGSLASGPLAALVYYKIMRRGADFDATSGLWILDPNWSLAGWLVLMVFGLAVVFSMWRYNSWLRNIREEPPGL